MLLSTVWSARMVLTASCFEMSPIQRWCAEGHFLIYCVPCDRIMSCLTGLAARAFAEPAIWCVMWCQISKPMTAPDSASGVAWFVWPQHMSGPLWGMNLLNNVSEKDIPHWRIMIFSAPHLLWVWDSLYESFETLVSLADWAFPRSLSCLSSLSSRSGKTSLNVTFAWMTSFDEAAAERSCMNFW